MAGSFGIIHELADIEVMVRRELSTARHEISCAESFIQNIVSPSEGRKTDDSVLINMSTLTRLASMLATAQQSIDRVIGD